MKACPPHQTAQSGQSVEDERQHARKTPSLHHPESIPAQLCEDTVTQDFKEKFGETEEARKKVTKFIFPLFYGYISGLFTSVVEQ